jgi:hypothetical protein
MEGSRADESPRRFPAARRARPCAGGPGAACLPRGTQSCAARWLRRRHDRTSAPLAAAAAANACQRRHGPRIREPARSTDTGRWTCKNPVPLAALLAANDSCSSRGVLQLTPEPSTPQRRATIRHRLGLRLLP